VSPNAKHIELTYSKKEEQLGQSRLPLFSEVSEGLALIRRNTIVPILYHVKWKDREVQPTKHGAAPSYIDLVQHGLRLAPEFATVDLSLSDDEIREVMRSKGSTRLIAHLHSTESWHSSYWVMAYERAQRLGFDIVRLSRTATCIDDNFAVDGFRARITAVETHTIPIIAYNTGPLGRTSCCFNTTMTPVTHEDIHAQGPESPRISAMEATKALYSSFVFEPMRFYIMGASAGYSLSPAMHSAGYRACGMPHTYTIHQTSSVSELRALVNDPQFGGCSISLPFKLEVIALTHSLSCHAKAIGAINTLIPVRHLLKDGSIPDDLQLFKERNRSGPVLALYGENTDWIGIRACVRRGLSPANAVSPRTTVLIVGAGGMARAAIYAMLQLGVRNIFIYNRTTANAEKLITHFRGLLDDSTIRLATSVRARLPPDSKIHMETLSSLHQAWPENFRNPTIVVSCIPTHGIGADPSPDFTIPEQWLQSRTGGVVMEVSYPVYLFTRHRY
jgi:shikimate 5-dehydrogenase